MDDLQKLLENAGLREDSYDHERNNESLNDLSRLYTFEIDNFGKIRVYIQGGHQKEFTDFDDMLENFGNT